MFVYNTIVQLWNQDRLQEKNVFYIMVALYTNIFLMSFQLK